jgi:glycosyltransferase involved in cell wall biosynthesis
MTLQSPTFSVVIPTYNRAQLLLRAVHSVLNQTFQNFEIVIADDASTDGIDATELSQLDNRIVYVRRQENGGNAAARNTGVTAAKGRYIAFLDDDDEYMPHFLEESARVLQSQPDSVGFSWSGIQKVKEENEKEVVVEERIWMPTYRNREDAYVSFLRSRRVGTDCGLVVKRSCFDVVGLFDESLRKAVDTDMLIRLVRNFDFVVVPSIQVKIHDHAGPRVRKNAAAGADAYARIIAKHLETIQQHPSLWAALHYKTGWLFYHAKNRAQGRAYLLKALSRRPFFFKAWSALILFETFGTEAPQVHRQISQQKEQMFG